MAGVIATIPKFQFSANGVPMVGGTLDTYIAGSTTPATTWQDSALTIANTNPISLDARGECVLWLDSTKSYKFVLKNALGVIQWTQDNIIGGGSLADRLRTDLSASSGASLVGFQQAGTGAVPTTVQSKLRETVSVKDFGAKGDGATDDTAAIQSAWNAVKLVGGGSIFLPPGTYIISSAINITGCSNIVFYGAGNDASIIKSTSATADIFYDSGISWWRTFRDFSIASSVTRTAGSSFNLAGERRGLFDRIRITGHFNGFTFLGFEQTELRSCSITKPSGAGTGIICGTPGAGGQGANLLINDCFLRGQDDVSQTNTLGNTGIAIYDVDAVFAVNTDLSAFLLHDLLIAPNTRAANHYFVQCFFDATDKADCVRVQGAGVKQQFNFTGCWFASAGKLTATATESCGFRAFDAGQYQDMLFSGCRFYNNCGSGVLLEMPSADFTFDGCNFFANGIAAANIRNGFWWAPASVATNGPNISGCRFGAANAPSDIRFEPNCRYYSVVGCSIKAGISNAGTGGILSKNPGYNPVSSTVTVTASPFTYANNTGDTQTITISGGTVSAVLIDGLAVAGATNTSVALPQGKGVEIRYTDAPTVLAIGH